MSRSDISENLIHFTQGEDYEAAFNRLKNIIRDGFLEGTTNMRKGGYRCVSFSEAPLASMPKGLLNLKNYSRYSPFGFMVSKKWLYELGGRPVIYQPDSDYENLPEQFQWRHVLYEIRDGYQPVDFTWEREWRIPCEKLHIDCTVAQLVVPEETWAKRLVKEHETKIDYKIQQYKQIMDEDTAELYRNEPYCWKINFLHEG